MAATLDQDGFRGRNDDGSESTATWIAAVNTDWTQDVDENFRVRFHITVEDVTVLLTAQLQYNLNSGGWNDVNASSSVVQSSASPNETDNVITLEQIGGPGSYWRSWFDEVDGVVTTENYFSGEETEPEYCVQIIGTDVADTDTIELRVVGQGAAKTALNTYSQTPTITVNEGGGGGGLSIPVAMHAYRQNSQSVI